MPLQSDQTITLDKAPLFAYAYIRHHGNGTQAAMEVFDVSGGKNPRNTAHAIASCYLRKVTVQTVLHGYLLQQNESMLSALRFLRETIEDKSAPFADRMKCVEVAYRLAGIEVSESLSIALGVARIRAGKTTFPATQDRSCMDMFK